MVHKLVAPLQHQTADYHHDISWHHQCESCYWPAILDRWCNQCHWCASGKNKGDLEQEIIIISQLHVINAQWLRDLDRLAVRWNTTDIRSICQEECKSILIEMEMMQKMGTPVPYSGFSIDKSEIQDVAAPKDVDWHGDSTAQFKSSNPCWLQWSGNQHVCFSNTTSSSRRFVPLLPFDWAFSSASYQSCNWSPQTYVCNPQYCSPSL